MSSQIFSITRVKQKLKSCPIAKKFLLSDHFDNIHNLIITIQDKTLNHSCHTVDILKNWWLPKNCIRIHSLNHKQVENLADIVETVILQIRTQQTKQV